MSNNKGIPTIGVRGIQFRSRIEAQWACIFEKLGWDWEYEPIDLQGYIPDFIIKFDEDEILIEIKGDTNIWKEEVYKEHKEKIIKSGWKGIFGILGSTYKNSENWGDNNCPIIGIVCYQYDSKWIDDDLIIRKEGDRRHKCLNLKDGWFFGGDLLLYDICGGFWKDTIETKKDFEKIWVDAKNKVQWKGEQNKSKSNFTPKRSKEVGEGYIKYEGLSDEESKYFREILKTFDKIIDKEFLNLKTIKDILIHELINQDDKKRIMRCYEKVKMHYEMCNELPIWGNIDIFIDNKAYIYKVHYVPQEPVEMNENNFMDI
jgi:hypothetical protein